MDDASRIRFLEEQIKGLEKDRLAALQALDMAASMGRLQACLAADGGLRKFLAEIMSQVQSIIQFDIVAVYLLSKEDNDFHQVLCEPEEAGAGVEAEVAGLIQDHSFAWTLRRRKPTFFASAGGGRLLLHALATGSTVEGMFVGRLGKGRGCFSDSSLALFSMIMLASAHALENCELYKLLRRANLALESKVAQRTAELEAVNLRLEQEAMDRAESDARIQNQALFMDALLKALPNPLFYKDKDGRYLGCNPAFEDFFGLDEERIVGKTVEQVWPDSLARQYRQRDQDLLLARGPQVYQGQVVDRDGALREVLFCKAPYAQANGELIGIVGIFVDITERIQAEERLRESEERMRTIMDTIPAGVVIVDVATREVVDANPAALRILGVDRAHAVGRVCHEFLCLAPRRGCPYLDGGERVENAEMTLLTAGGREVPILKTVAEVTIHGRDYLVESFLDMSEQKKLMDLRADVERMTRHDLKGPLNGIIGLPKVLLAELKLSDVHREMLEAMRDAGHMMLRMINSSLDMYKMEVGTYQHRPAPVDVMEVLGAVKTELRDLLAATHLRLVTTLDGREPGEGEQCVIEAEEMLLYTMLSNLIRNAVEASPEGCAVTVSIATGDDVTIAIHNTGHVPEELRERFFEKYATAGKAGGAGLGTYSASLSARVMGGSVALECEEGGVTVVVRLPGARLRRAS